MAAIAYVLDSTHCDAAQWIEGVIVPGDHTVGIKTDQGVVIPLFWARDNTAVLQWGHRYKIGGEYPFDGSLWACAGASAVIPE